MRSSRKFDVGDVLSITTGCVVSPRGMDGIYDILHFMTGDSLFTHQLVRAASAAAPVLLTRFPQLVKVKKPCFLFPDGSPREEQEAMVSAWVREQGLDREFEIEPLPAGTYISMNPMSELIKMRDGRTDGLLVAKIAEDGSVAVSEVPEPPKVLS